MRFFRLSILGLGRAEELLAKESMYEELRSRLRATEERISEWENWEYSHDYRTYLFTAERVRIPREGPRKGIIRQPKERASTCGNIPV